MPLVQQLLSQLRLLIVFDDFEQNLTVGGDGYRDATVTEVMAGLARAAARPAGGGLLVTSRYPLPGLGTVLATIAVPPLSPAELRRLFLRLPALRDLDAADCRLLTRTVGGHPRLIEFTDALLRGGRANLSHVRDKLQALADHEHLRHPPPPNPRRRHPRRHGPRGG